jgi:hypothetical protein
MMTPISRGFGGRRRDDVDPSQLPLGLDYERRFPVMSAGPTRRKPLGGADLLDPGIPCVTKWSKLDPR